MASDLPAPITVFWRSSTDHAGGLPLAQAALAHRPRPADAGRSTPAGGARSCTSNRRYLRVVAQGRVFDLFYDRRQRRWFLERAL